MICRYWQEISKAILFKQQKKTDLGLEIYEKIEDTKRFFWKNKKN